MTDYAAILAAQPAPTNGRDPLEVAGVTSLRPGVDLADVAHALRRLAPLLGGKDALEFRTCRARAIAALEGARISGAAGWVDAALGSGKGDGQGPPAQGQAVAFADVEPWPDPVDGTTLLNRSVAFNRRYLSLPPWADVLLAVLALYSYAADAFAAAVYVVLHSPAPQCGKTRALEVLQLLVRRPWLTIVPSTAVLFRVLEMHQPMLLLDEAEVVHGRGDAAQDIRALLQSGYRRGSFVPRCVGENNEVRNFRVFGPKVFALIGELPAALFDRCIRVEMQRRARGEEMPRFRPRHVEPEALELRRMAARWARDHYDALLTVDVPPCAFLDERAEEVWEPLLAVGIVAGGDWYERLREAARHLSGGRTTTSVGVELLADIRAVFDARGLTQQDDRLASDDLAADLASMEGHRWPEWSHGRPITATAVARLLKPFGVAPTKSGDWRGYKREYFAPSWTQYIEPPSRPEFSNDGHYRADRNRPAGESENTQPPTDSPHGDRVLGAWAVQMQGGGQGDACPQGHPLVGGMCPACDRDAFLAALDAEAARTAEPPPPMLTVTALGSGRYVVNGGAAPHHVQITGSAAACDCPDHHYRRHDCKHIDAVRREVGA